MPNWTKEQKQAIYKKGTNILVAAAAGSGKTAVLVERIINKVINEKIDIDKLLVVTFTNAAAAEMKERVLDALYKKIEEDPENKDLQRQITLINMAQICTIDSFCLDIVKNHFYELENISPNFRIAETTEIELLKQETLDEIFEEKYINEDENFTDLIKTYTNYRDDTPLKDLILKIYNFISSNPSPLEWLQEKVEMFNLKDKLDEDFSQTIWGTILLNDVSEEVQDDMAMLKDVVSSLSYDVELEDFKNAILSDIEQLKNLQNNLNNWDNTYNIAQNFKFIDWPRKKVTSDIKDEAKAIRDQVRKKLYDKLNNTFVSDSKQSNQDIYDMYKTLTKLKDLIIEFDKQFSKKKREKNILDFSDIEHFALSILVKKDEQGNLVKTEVAEKYTQKFEEIAIDEYQDSNLVQETILTSVSRGNNLFMVGDVKQSIYKFRQAMPKLFLSKYNEYEIVEDEAEKLETIQDMKKGKKIQLFKNFRSRGNILDFTNLVFQNIMSEKIGEIEYNKNEYLNLGATDYKETNQELKTEIDIIESTHNEDAEEIEISSDNDDEIQDLEKIEDIEIEAKYIAKKIKELVQSKYQIYDRKAESFRDIKYKDIVILLRSTKEKANIYEQEMINLGIPVFSDSSEQYLETIEIQTILNLLKIIDNPIQDIPLVSVLRSNIGKFTDNELVEIRLSDKYDNFYNCMQKAVPNVNSKLKEKINNFLENLQKWRKEKEYLALDELIWKIYIETGFYNYVGLMPNGELRQANLKMLFEKARQYESASFKGLYNFIQFMEKLQLSSGDMGTAKIIGENDDVVRIMSIHKSKGLEFPVVFLANTNKQFNMQDIRKDSVLLHQDLGIGVKYINYDEQIQYDTLSREALKKQVENENISEEMRILYVALTRAKEKLYITGIGKDIQEKIEKWENLNKIYPKENGKINHLLIKKAKSYLDWIILVYINAKESHSLKLEIKDKKEEMNKWNKLLNNVPENIQEEIEFEHQENLYKTIQKELEYKYAFLTSTVIPTKISVTKIKELEQEKIQSLEEITSQQRSHTKNIEKSTEKLKETENIKTSSKEEKSEFRKPEFIKENKDEKLTSAQKGTITHLCLQKLDTRKEYNLEEIQNFITELQNTNILTEKEAKSINPFKILEFTKSQIGQDLKEAKEIYKEKPFYLNISAKEIYEDQNLEENILVQGIIDLYYIDKNDNLILVDYKTDYVPEGKENELINKYNSQLSLYKTALEEALNRKVDKKYIYSIYLGKALEIKNK